MKNVKNIIFDLGGVIINLDFSRTIEAFRALGATNLTADLLQHLDLNELHFYDYETGKISSAEFRKIFCEYFGLDITEHQFDQAWNALLLDIPKERLAVIAQLRQRYRVFLFSNTNELHWKKVFVNLQNDHRIETLEEYFEKEYYSHRLGMRKPNKEGFLHILDENQLLPQETLFIDDLHANILGAQSVGLQTWHVEKDKTILDLPLLIPSPFKGEG